MDHAHEDLTATVEGKFSPDDWQKILERAEIEFQTYFSANPNDGEHAAWAQVMRDFNHSRYWGFAPNYKKPKVKKAKNLGSTFIWMGFNSLVGFKVAVLWFGQIYSRSDDPKDAWIFFTLLFLIVGNFVFFLWKNHAHPD